MSESKSIDEAADRIVALERELESAGLASTASDEVAMAREALHRWVDSVVGVVASPGVGRVALIHENGRQSSIASPDLPFLLSRTVKFEK